MILLNIHEDSDAYTYIKPLLRHRDGRRDIKALRDRYSNSAVKLSIINEAKASLENLRYKNERSFSFERFSAKLQKAYDNLEENNRGVRNEDIMDDLWPRIQDDRLTAYIASLKVDYQRNPKSYKLVLQDIASELSSKRKVMFASAPRQASALYT